MDRITQLRRRRALLASTALIAGLPLGMPMAAHAQDVSDPEAEAGSSDFDEIVVTGTARGVSQFESSVAVTTFDQEDIRADAPFTITDLYATVPGVYAETSGGEAAANIFVRGIPAPGQYRFTKLQVDGMPTFEESGLPFTPPESFIKIDEMLERVEVIRGGTATIFASNAAGGIINNITKKGSDTPEGYVGVEYGDFDHYRLDGYYAGPISDDWSFAAGGFYRVNDGVRDPGFTANDGGQFRANFTRRGIDSELNVYGHVIDDRTIFYLPVPLGLDGDGDLDDIDGFDALTGTLTSDDVQRVSIVRPGGINTPDLADGIRTRSWSIGGSYEREIGDEWTVFNNARYVEGDVTFNAIFSLSAPLAAEDFLAGQLGRAQDAFGDDVDRLALRFLGEDVGTESTFAFGEDGNNGNGLVINSGWWNQETEVRNFQDDLRVTRSFEAAGRHDFTVGLYGSFANYQSFWNFNNILQEVDSSPRGLEVYAVDDDGDDGAEVVGAVTQNAFLQYGSFYRNYDADVRILALYAADEWQVTDQLRVDGGIRFENLRINGAAERLETFDLSDENPLISRGELPTLADDNATFGSGQFDPFERTYDEISWTLGANYVFTDQFSAYARINDAFRTPDPNDLAANPAAADDIPVNDIFQAEAGIKVDTDFARAFVTGFFSDFSDQLFSDPILDADGNTIEAQSLLESETIGVEAEVDFGPYQGFGLNVKATIQDPEISNLEILGDVGAGVQADAFDGNDIQRIANEFFVVQPSYEFVADDFDGLVYAQVFHVGDRFSNNGNTVLLPDYTTLSAGLLVNYRGLEFTFVGDNLTNTIGVTEGNPRQEALATGGDAQVTDFGRPILGRNFRVKVGYRF